jgi:hypothetical protein
MNYSNGLTAAGALTAAVSAIRLLDLPKTFKNCAPEETLKNLCINILNNQQPNPLSSINPAGELEKRARCTEWANSPVCDEYDSYFKFYATLLTVGCLVVALNIIFKKCHHRQSGVSLKAQNDSVHRYRERQIREKQHKTNRKGSNDSVAHSNQKIDKTPVSDQNNNNFIGDQSDQKSEDKKEETSVASKKFEPGTTDKKSATDEVDFLEQEWAKVRARVEKLRKKQ